MSKLNQRKVIDTIDNLKVRLNKMLENGIDVNNQELIQLSQELDVWINRALRLNARNH